MHLILKIAYKDIDIDADIQYKQQKWTKSMPFLPEKFRDTFAVKKKNIAMIALQ